MNKKQVAAFLAAVMTVSAGGSAVLADETVMEANTSAIEAATAQAAPAEELNVTLSGDTTEDPTDTPTEIDWNATEITLSSAEDLKAFRDQVNGGKNFSKQTIKLAENIDLNNEPWTPVGTGTNRFRGIFDGDNHTISNLTVTADYNYAGLFGIASDSSTIKNLNVQNAAVSGKQSVGVVVGSCVSKIENCHVSGLIQVSGTKFVGGIIGYGYANVKNCSAVGNDNSSITSTYDNVGGIIGFEGEGNYTISDNYVENIRISGSREVGGIIVGTSNDSTIKYVFDSNHVKDAEVSGSGNGVGGMIGRINSPVASMANNIIESTQVNGKTASGTGLLVGATGYGVNSENIADASSNNQIISSTSNGSQTLGTASATVTFKKISSTTDFLYPCRNLLDFFIYHQLRILTHFLLPFRYYFCFFLIK